MYDLLIYVHRALIIWVSRVGTEIQLTELSSNEQMMTELTTVMQVAACTFVVDECSIPVIHGELDAF